MSHYHEHRLNDYCHVSSQIAKHCDEHEVYCDDCGSAMLEELGDDFLTCQTCFKTNETEED